MDKQENITCKDCYFKELNGRKYVFRNNTLDEYIAKETCYDKATYSQDDVWLDVGGCIGVFPVKYASSVASVHTFEPDQDNLNVLRQNLKLNHITNCVVHEQAIVWDNRKTTEFYLNVKKNKGSHSMFVHRGRTVVTVPCVNINSVLRDIKPNKIKMDIEGAEYELIKTIHNWDAITELLFEYHTAILRDRDGLRLSELYSLLARKGYTVRGPSPTALGGSWYHNVHCIKT